MPNTLANVLRAGVRERERERERTGVRPGLKVGMGLTSTAPGIGRGLDELPTDILRRINDETIHCNGPLFRLTWTKQGDHFMYSIHGFGWGTPSATVIHIRDLLDRYWAALFKEKTGRDIVWNHHFSPSQENPTGNGINWVSNNFDSGDLSFALCKEWAYSATNSMIRDLGYSLEASSEEAPEPAPEPVHRQTLIVNFDICWWRSKKLDQVMPSLKAA